MHSLVGQLTVTILMELVGRMVPHANTSGALLPVSMNRQLTLVQHAPVLLGALMETVFPHLWAKTIFVSQA